MVNDVMIFQGIQVLLGLIWTWTVACRIMRMDQQTRPRIKWAMSVFGAGGLAFGFAPLMPPSYAALFYTLAGASTCYMQWATSSLWSYGVPEQFQRQLEETDHENRRRI